MRMPGSSPAECIAAARIPADHDRAALARVLRSRTACAGFASASTNTRPTLKRGSRRTGRSRGSPPLTRELRPRASWPPWMMMASTSCSTSMSPWSAIDDEPLRAVPTESLRAAQFFGRVTESVSAQRLGVGALASADEQWIAGGRRDDGKPHFAPKAQAGHLSLHMIRCGPSSAGSRSTTSLSSASSSGEGPAQDCRGSVQQPAHHRR